MVEGLSLGGSRLEAALGELAERRKALRSDANRAVGWVERFR